MGSPLTLIESLSSDFEAALCQRQLVGNNQMATLLYACPDAAKYSRSEPFNPIKRYCSTENVQDVVTRMAKPAKHTIEAREAVKRFLYDVVDVVESTYPVWEKRLSTFIEDTPMVFEDRRRLTEVNPVRHYFYAAVVAIEASKIRTLYPVDMAEELLADMNDLIDKLCGRSDQMVSDLVFDLMQRLRVTEIDDTKKPHDVAMKRIAELLQLTKMEATRDLTKDIVFRQEMGQPLAVSTHHWWNAFKGSQQLAQTVPARNPVPAEQLKKPQTFKVETVH